MGTTIQLEKIKILRRFAMWPNFEESASPFEILYYVYWLVMLGNMMLMSIINGTSALFAESIGDLCGRLIPVLTGILCVAKTILLLVKQNQIKQLVKDINEYYYPRYASATQETVATIQRSLKFESKLYRIYFAYASILGVAYLIRPLPKIIKVGFSENVTGDLPYTYPFDLKIGSLWYLVAYIQQFFGIIWYVVPPVMADGFNSTCVLHLCTHFDILISNIVNEEVDVHDEVMMKKRLSRIIVHHQDLIRYAEDIRRIAAPAVFLQILLGAIMVAVGIFKFTEMPSTSPAQGLAFMFFLFGKLLQLYLFCWIGQKLEDKSFAVSEAVYNTQWYEADHCRKEIQFMILRAQKPLQFSVSNGLFRFSFASYMELLNGGYSYFTMLSSFKGN